MNLDDLDLDKVGEMLNSSSDTVSNTQNNNNYSKNQNSYNKFNNNFNKGGFKNNFKKKEPKVYTPLKPDSTKFIASPIKTFTIDIKSIITGNKEEEAVKIAKLMFSRGFVYRSSLEIKGNEAYNNLELEIRNLENAKTEGYKVWANMEVEETNGLEVCLEEPADLAYQYAFNYNSHFENMSDVIKRFMARQMHIYLGKDLLQPINVVFTYTKCGSLKLSKNFDFKTSGQASNYIKMANEFGASLFNFGNNEFKDNFVSYLKAVAN